MLHTNTVALVTSSRNNHGELPMIKGLLYFHTVLQSKASRPATSHTLRKFPFLTQWDQFKLEGLSYSRLHTKEWEVTTVNGVWRHSPRWRKTSFQQLAFTQLQVWYMYGKKRGTWPQPGSRKKLNAVGEHPLAQGTAWAQWGSRLPLTHSLKWDWGQVSY